MGLPRTSARGLRASLVALASSLALLGCGSSAPRPAAMASGNEAVRARLASLPELTFPADREIRAATAEEVRAYCTWQARAVGGYDVEASCADGSSVRIAAACTDRDNDAMREGMAICAITLGEWAACVAARRAAPCDGGLFGERLPECEAFAGCIEAAMTEGDEGGAGASADAAP